MSRGFLPMMATVGLSVAVYYYWSVFLNKNENIGIVLGIVTAVLVSAFFTKIKKR